MMVTKSAETCGWISIYDRSIFYQCAFVCLGLLYKCKYFLMHGYGTLTHPQMPASTCPFLEQINSVYTPPLHFLNTSSSSKFSIFFRFSHQNTTCNFPVKRMCNIHPPSNFSWFDNRNNAVTGTQVKITIIRKRGRKCNRRDVCMCVRKLRSDFGIACVWTRV